MADRQPVTFDTQKFLDDYEKRASHISLASATAQSSNPDTPDKDKPKQEVRKKAEGKSRPEAKVEPKPDSDSGPLDREMEYMENFILPKKYSRISRKSRQVPISEDFKRKIQKLLIFFSECGTITEYVNNVLDKHFQDYDDVIRHMSDNNLKI